MPLINTPIDQIAQVTDSLESFRTRLHNSLLSLDSTISTAQIQTTIFDALGPGGANVLVNKVGASTVDAEDVVVTGGGAAGVDISINIAKSVSFDSALGPGIDTSATTGLSSTTATSRST